MSRSLSSSAVVRAVMALAALSALAAPAQASSRWTAILEIGGEPTAVQEPRLTFAYSGAMADYRLYRQENASVRHLAGRIAAPTGQRWRWRAEDGGTVQRVGDGVFRLTGRDCVTALCSDVDCFAAGWPLFECTDGRQREMAAPDLATVIFDGVKYTRSLPPVDEQLLEELADEDFEGEDTSFAD